MNCEGWEARNARENEWNATPFFPFEEAGWILPTYLFLPTTKTRMRICPPSPSLLERESCFLALILFPCLRRRFGWLGGSGSGSTILTSLTLFYAQGGKMIARKPAAAGLVCTVWCAGLGECRASELAANNAAVSDEWVGVW
jgi:hypothetical protein